MWRTNGYSPGSEDDPPCARKFPTPTFAVVPHSNSRQRLPTALLSVALACALGATTGCRSAASRIVEAEPQFREAFTGFYLADAATGEELAARDADKLFTPASNTKLLTAATALAWLPPDSLPVLSYRVDGDTLRLWALAYPLLGADDAPYNRRIRDDIAAWPGPVELGLHGYAELPRLGEGWMWDDYPYAFARERAGLPLYGNLVAAWRTEMESPGGGASLEWHTRPGFLAVGESPDRRRGGLRRDEMSNRLVANPGTALHDTLTAPLYGANALASQLLEDFTGRPIPHHNHALPADWRARTWLGLPRDEALAAMMLPSDNFLAEQLLLQAGLFRADLTSPRAIRARARDSVLLLDESALAWADASGISHYNLVTPRALTEVVRTSFVEGGRVRTNRLEVLPQGGRTGTIEDWYAGELGVPYVFAKTGTLRHNHALTGLLRADSGRWLAFSFMHNHYRGSSREYKRAMQRALAAIRAAY